MLACLCGGTIEVLVLLGLTSAATVASTVATSIINKKCDKCKKKGEPKQE